MFCILLFFKMVMIKQKVKTLLTNRCQNTLWNMGVSVGTVER